MDDADTRIETEMLRLKNGPASNERPGGMGTVRFVARCSIDPELVLRRVKSVLLAVDEVASIAWLSDEEWKKELPDWFVVRCAEPLTLQQAEEQLRLRKHYSIEEELRFSAEYEWSLPNWLYCVNPLNRQWYWWDAEAIPENAEIRVAVEVLDWPFPWSDLRWLFRAAGATSLEAEE